MTDSPLTPEEVTQFEMIRDLFADPEPGNDKHLGLIRTRLDDKEVAVIIASVPDGEGDTDVYPIAILLNDDLFSRLTRPS